MVESNEYDDFDEEDLDAAASLVNVAATSIANAQLYEQVNEANRAKSEFVSMVSHELKTPITAIRGYTDLMLAGLTGEVRIYDLVKCHFRYFFLLRNFLCIPF